MAHLLGGHSCLRVVGWVYSLVMLALRCVRCIWCVVLSLDSCNVLVQHRCGSSSEASSHKWFLRTYPSARCLWYAVILAKAQLVFFCCWVFACLCINACNWYFLTTSWLTVHYIMILDQRWLRASIMNQATWNCSMFIGGLTPRTKCLIIHLSQP